MAERRTAQTTPEREAAEHNAIAWLAMTDDDLVRCSASLDESPHLSVEADLFVANPRVHPDVHNPEARAATDDELTRLRARADEFAAEHAGATFVKQWLRDNPDRVDRRFQPETADAEEQAREAVRQAVGAPAAHRPAKRRPGRGTA